MQMQINTPRTVQRRLTVIEAASKARMSESEFIEELFQKAAKKVAEDDAGLPERETFDAQQMLSSQRVRV